MVKTRGNLKRNKAGADLAARLAKRKNKGKRYSHARARELLRTYYASPTPANMNAVLAEFEFMIEAVLYRHGALKYNETEDYRQACRIRLWELVSKRKIDPDDAFGAYLNRTFIRAYRHEAKKLFRQQFKTTTAEERLAYAWRPEISPDPVDRAEAREILENATDFCSEWAKSFRFTFYQDIYLLVVEYYFLLGVMPSFKDIILYHRLATPEQKLEARIVYTAAVVHFRLALQSTLRGERLRHADQ